MSRGREKGNQLQAVCLGSGVVGLFEGCVGEEEQPFSKVSINWETTRRITGVKEIESIRRRMGAIGGVEGKTIPNMLPVVLCGFAILTQLSAGSVSSAGGGGG